MTTDHHLNREKTSWGERTLWCAVVHRVFADGPRALKRWGDADFRFVCGLAGVDYAYFRRAADDMIAGRTRMPPSAFSTEDERDRNAERRRASRRFQA